MKTTSDTTLLKEYLQEVLVEDGATGTWMDAFIDPFLDIGRTALFAIEKTAGHFKSYVRKTVMQVASALIPFIKVEWDRLQKEEQQKLEAIDKKYGGVIGRNMAALGHQDLWFLSFLVSPQTFIAQKILPRSVETALEMGFAFLPNWAPIQNLLKRYKTITSLGLDKYQAGKSGATVGHGGDMGMGDMGGYGDYGGLYDHKYPALESLLTEAPLSPKEAFEADVKALFLSPEFAQALASSPLSYEMHKQVVTDIVRQVSDFMRFDTPEKLRSKIGADWAKIEKDVSQTLQKQMGSKGTAEDNNPGEAPEGNETPVARSQQGTEAARAAISQAMVAAAHTFYKKQFTEKLQELSRINPAMANLYTWGISQIQKMS